MESDHKNNTNRKKKTQDPRNHSNNLGVDFGGCNTRVKQQQGKETKKGKKTATRKSNNNKKKKPQDPNHSKKNTIGTKGTRK